MIKHLKREGFRANASATVAAVSISTFLLTDKKPLGERGRRKASRADMKRAGSQEERVDVEGPTVRA